MIDIFFKRPLDKLFVEESEHNLRIEKIAEMILSDNISLDMHEQDKLKK